MTPRSSTTPTSSSSSRCCGALADDLTTTADAPCAAPIEEAPCSPRARLLELLPAPRLDLPRRAVQLRAQAVRLARRTRPNKAMNLNSYIGLMGGSYRDTRDRRRPRAGARPARQGDLEVPDPDYVLTLDADSVLLPEYCLRLVHLMEQTSTPRSRVAQTPYSAFPGSSTRIERIAGATTDLQHIVHQGMTYYDATFWVGANAVLRKRALDDIARSTFVGQLGDPPLHPGPDRHRGHRVDDRPRHPRLDAAQLPRAARLQRHPARLRLALHPAPALGQRRPADPAQALAHAPRPGRPRRAQHVRRDVPPGQLHGVDLLELASACCSCWPIRSTASCSARCSD